MSELQEHYNNLRLSSNKHTFAFLVNYTREFCTFQLNHYCTHLIYTQLEPHFLQHTQSKNDNVDISLKEHLSIYDACLFYGAVFPYFDLVNQLIHFQAVISRSRSEDFAQFTFLYYRVLRVIQCIKIRMF